MKSPFSNNQHRKTPKYLTLSKHAKLKIDQKHAQNDCFWAMYLVTLFTVFVTWFSWLLFDGG